MSEQDLEEVKSESAIVDDFANFLKQYHFSQIEALVYSENPIFHLDYNSLVSTEKTEYLCDLLHEEADKALSCLQQAVKSVINEIDAEIDTEKLDIPVRVSNWDERKSLRDINSSLEGQLITFDCIVTRSSEKRPYLFASVYVCRSCGKIIPSIRNEFIKKCPDCEDKLVLHKKKSRFTDCRFIHIQELPEDLPAGHLPSKNTLRVFGTDLTKSDRCRPGTRITVTALVRFDYDSSTMSDLRTHDPLGLIENFGVSLKLVLDANNIEKKEIENTGSQNLTQTDIDKIEKMKMDTDLLEKTLVSSFAPHIFGHEVLKESILLLMAGASPGHSQTHTVTNTRISIPTRGDMHILLVGNPGIAKSKLLEFASLVSPRVIKTTGRGSTAAGLTAAVVKDEGGIMMLEAGAVVLGDLGLTVIDEFDKLRSEDRSALHEAMEQQTVSISKGGIIATLNSRTSILAAANPVFGAYDLYKSIAENTELPPSLLSRFDLIFALPDIVDEERDRSIAQAMLSQHRKKTLGRSDLNTTTAQENIFPIEFLAKYLFYVKNHQTQIPSLTKEAEKLIEEQYTYLRKFAEKNEGMNVAKTITVTPRIVDALYRLSVARARLLLKPQVDERDVNRTIYLINEMYRSFGIDIQSGANLQIMYGAPLSRKNKNAVFLDICNEISEGGTEDLDIEVLIDDFRKSVTTTEMEANKLVNKAIQEGVLSHRRGTIYRFNKDALRIQ